MDAANKTRAVSGLSRSHLEQMPTQYKGILDGIGRIVEDEGAGALFKGTAIKPKLLIEPYC